jgi:pyruvate/oxaloacetate carboxyltransferase
MEEKKPTQAPKKEETKNLPLENIPAPILHNLKVTINALIILRSEVEEKRETSLSRTSKINELVSKLQATKGITVDVDGHKRFQQSIATYLALLQSVIDEINTELTALGPCASEKPPETIPVPANSPIDNAAIYLMARIEWLRRQNKKIRKDLTVSYSRYSYGFDSQEQRLEALQRYTDNKS